MPRIGSAGRARGANPGPVRAVTARCFWRRWNCSTASPPSSPSLRRAGADLSGDRDGRTSADARPRRATIERRLSQFPTAVSGGSWCLQWVVLGPSILGAGPSDTAHQILSDQPRVESLDPSAWYEELVRRGW